MSSFWSKVKDFVGFSDPLEYDDEGEEYEQVYREEQKRDEARRSPQASTPAPSPSSPAPASETQPGTAAPAPRRRIPGNPAKGNVIGMPGNGGINEVLVIEPRSFEEAPQIVQHLRDRKSVILNLTLMDSDQAQRSVDFVAGATFAIDGHQERVGDGIFLFTPSTVMISTEVPSQLRQANQAFGGNFRVGPEPPRRAQG